MTTHKFKLHHNGVVLIGCMFQDLDRNIIFKQNLNLFSRIEKKKNSRIIDRHGRINIIKYHAKPVCAHFNAAKRQNPGDNNPARIHIHSINSKLLRFQFSSLTQRSLSSRRQEESTYKTILLNENEKLKRSRILTRESGEREMEENASNPVVEVSGEGKGESIEGKDGPPVDDCCPICFGDFTIPCKANCGHWYCG